MYYWIFMIIFFNYNTKWFDTTCIIFIFKIMYTNIMITNRECVKMTVINFMEEKYRCLKKQWHLMTDLEGSIKWREAPKCFLFHSKNWEFWGGGKNYVRKWQLTFSVSWEHLFFYIYDSWIFCRRIWLCKAHENL